ncbi:hypothetical protein [Glutamicibacter creatinolyticus]|uniref:hypothetical protein n=1 Tax=Glutamicibacter creatinolyticus TaxID=162496 RepID=UPI0032174351
MAVHKGIDIDIQDLQEMVRTTRNSHLNHAHADAHPDDALLDQRNRLATKLLRAGWIAPTYARALKVALLEGSHDAALELLADLLGVDLVVPAKAVA